MWSAIRNVARNVGSAALRYIKKKGDVDIIDKVMTGGEELKKAKDKADFWKERGTGKEKPAEEEISDPTPERAEAVEKPAKEEMARTPVEKSWFRKAADVFLQRSSCMGSASTLPPRR